MGIGTAVYVSMRKYILRWCCRFVPKLQTFHSQLPTFFFPPYFQFPIYFQFRTSHLPSPISHFLFPLVTSSHSSLTAFATSELPLPISHLQFPTIIVHFQVRNAVRLVQTLVQCGGGLYFSPGSLLLSNGYPKKLVG